MYYVTMIKMNSVSRLPYNLTDIHSVFLESDVVNNNTRKIFYTIV